MVNALHIAASESYGLSLVSVIMPQWSDWGNRSDNSRGSMIARGLYYGSKGVATYDGQDMMLNVRKRRDPHRCKRVVGSIPNY